MLFLPGITFPWTTCYFDKSDRRYLERKTLHLLLSAGIYHGVVWLFSGEGTVKYITILAGFLGSLLFQMITKIILRKEITFLQIFIVAILSGLAFYPYTTLSHSSFSTGLALFLWTVINGFLLNLEYRKTQNLLNSIE